MVLTKYARGQFFKQWFDDHIFQRILKNASWLLVGRIIGGVAGLGYLSLATHSLGVGSFGTLVLVQTYFGIIAGVTTFQSWQAVIRYGAISLQEQDRAAFQKLVKLTVLLDVLGVVAGVAIAVFTAPHIGPYIGWSDAMTRPIQYCSPLILFKIAATPTGLLRLYNRFDLLAVQGTLSPLICLLGTVIAAVIHAPLWGYLLAWMIAEAISGSWLILTSWRESWKRGVLKDMDWSIADLRQSHPGILKFCMVSNLHSSLPMAMRQTSPLIVGAIANPAAVALFRVSYELSTPCKTLAQLLTQSLYPELAQLSSQGKWKKFTGLILRSGGVLVGIGSALFVLGIFLGKGILEYFFGEAFIPAHNTLVLLVSAGICAMGSRTLEPALYAMGLPSLVLRVNVIAILAVYFPLLIVLTQHFGAMGAGMATLLTSALIMTLNSVLIWKQLSQRFRKFHAKNPTHWTST